MPTKSKPRSDPASLPQLEGDIVVETTTLNSKGGSLTATLRKNLRVAFSEGVHKGAGALLDFGKHGSVVLIAPTAADSGPEASHRYHITRMNDRRYVVDVIDDEAETVDPVTQAFLTLIVEQFKHGERELVSRDDAISELDDILSRRPVTPDKA